MNDLRDALLLIGPPQPGQVLFVDLRVVTNTTIEKFFVDFPKEWAGVRVQLIYPPNGQTVSDCVALGKIPEPVV